MAKNTTDSIKIPKNTTDGPAVTVHVLLARPAEREVLTCERATVLLNNCDITAKGATSIAEAIRINVTITKLDMNTNQISDTGATALAESLRANEVVRACKSAKARPLTAVGRCFD